MAEPVTSTELVAESPHYDKLRPADQYVSSSLSVDDDGSHSETEKLLKKNGSKSKSYTNNDEVLLYKQICI